MGPEEAPKGSTEEELRVGLSSETDWSCNRSPICNAATALSQQGTWCCFGVTRYHQGTHTPPPITALLLSAPVGGLC